MGKDIGNQVANVIKLRVKELYSKNKSAYFKQAE